MQANVGSADRAIRIVFAAALFVVGFGVLDGTLGTVVGAIGFVPLLTSLLGRCPAYRLFNINTCLLNSGKGD